tara:strand:- start:191 stop:859 length:669 start_codon:yes stop_codon:yes gene_type:complete
MKTNIIHNMDCLQGLKELPDNCIDLIVTDPPYRISYKSNYGTNEYKERVQHTDWDKDFNFSDYYSELWRVLKEDSFMYVWGRFENYEIMKALGMKRVLVWDKGHNSMGDLEDWGIGYELIYLFKKGKPKIRGSRDNGIIRITHIGYFDKTLHPTQKPTSVIRYLIEKSSDIGDIVLDAFMGSGTTAMACKQTDRRFIGYELESKYCDIANERLKQTQLEVFV